MSGTELTILIVFFQGMASFFSPCVLPLIPAYLMYLTGQTAEVMMSDAKAHRRLIINGIAFVLGFSIVFILLGATATGLGRFLLRNNDLLRRISGVVVIIFGLFHMELIPIKILNREKRLQMEERAPGFLSSILIGMGFSFGWTPCIGPVLSAVLVLASRSSTLLKGVGLLAVYSLGLGIPFLVLTVFLKYLWKYIRGIYKHMRIIKIISGLIIVIVGILIITNAFSFLSYIGY